MKKFIITACLATTVAMTTGKAMADSIQEDRRYRENRFPDPCRQ